MLGRLLEFWNFDWFFIFILGSGEADYIEDDASGIESEDPFSSSQFGHGKLPLILV